MEDDLRYLDQRATGSTAVDLLFGGIDANFRNALDFLISCNLCGLRLQAVGDLLAQLEKSETAGHLVSA